MALHSYKELIVWQKSVDLVVLIYVLTKQLPKDELFGLTSQMRRAAVSIPSNIAEGRFRGTKNDFLHFLRMAYASGAELETQLVITRKLFGELTSLEETGNLLEEVMRMLNKMVSALNPKAS